MTTFGDPSNPQGPIHTETHDPTSERAFAPPRSARLVTATVEAGGVRPAAFLRAAQGEPRGLWARGERWAAHRGVLAALQVEAGEGDRFGRIARAAEALPAPDHDDGRVRLYGGFSFRDDHRAEGTWAGFPTALFHLPEIELTRDAAGAMRLRVRALAAPDQVESVRASLRASAHALRDALLEAPRAAPGAGPRRAALLGTVRRGVWERAVTDVLQAIESGAVSKVVLARTLDVRCGSPVDPVDVAVALRRGNPATHVFLFEPYPGRVLVGAAPEAVATLEAGVFHATAVAGSVARGETPTEQARLAEILRTSAKDRAEQRIVVEDMVSRLRPWAEDIRVADEPHVLTLSRIQHLETDIEARVQEARTVLEIVEALHPTPAVCGVPREEALALLRAEEPFRRGWYAGPVGWFTLEGEGHFVPALRTAIGTATEWRLFAGAGIVNGSQPAAEWAETAIKFQPVLSALADSGVSLPEGAPGVDESKAGEAGPMRPPGGEDS